MIYIFSVALYYGKLTVAVNAHSKEQAISICKFVFSEYEFSEDDCTLVAIAPSMIFDDRVMEFMDCALLSYYQE